MQTDKTISYVLRKNIDQEKWDNCIKQAGNGLIYAYSGYLDQMAGDWDGLVYGEYEAVMPLPWRKKYGIYYLYQPFLTAQLGLFGNTIGPHLLSGFLKAIPEKFRLWEFSLNHRNVFTLPEYPLYKRTNYVLSLRNPYEKIAEGYRENIRRNINKSRQFRCKVRTGIGLDQIFKLAGQQDANPGQSDFTRFAKLYHELEQKGDAKSYGVFSSQDELISSAAFVFSHKRAYYLLVGNHPNGRTLGSSHALIDAFIKDHAGKDLLLDFEGSDIRNLAFFYSSFGASEEIYAAIKMNRLPWYLKWLKK